MTAKNDAKDEHNEDEKANLVSAHDDNNIDVNILHPYLLYLALKIHC
jgi:hypothetical protein